MERYHDITTEWGGKDGGKRRRLREGTGKAGRLDSLEGLLRSATGPAGGRDGREDSTQEEKPRRPRASVSFNKLKKQQGN